MARLSGREAIEWAGQHAATLSKYADPIEDERDGLTVAEAEDVAAEDPGLIYVDTEGTSLYAELVAPSDPESLRVVDRDGGVWVPSDEALAEIQQAADPLARAVEVCSTDPMRGEWHQ